MLEQLEEELYHLHLELPRHNLVVWTGGSMSEFVAAASAGGSA